MKYIFKGKIKIIKNLDNKIEENFPDLGPEEEFLHMTPRAQSIKEKNNKLNFIKFKTFALLCYEDKNVGYRLGENIGQPYISQRIHIWNM